MGSRRYVNVDPDLPAIPTGRHGVLTLQGVGGGGEGEHIYSNESTAAGFDGFSNGSGTSFSAPQSGYGDSGGGGNGGAAGGAGAPGTLIYDSASATKGYDGFEGDGSYDTCDTGMGGRHMVGQGQEEYSVPAKKKNRRDKRSKSKSAESSAEPQGYTQVDPDRVTNRRGKKGSVAVRMPMLPGHFPASRPSCVPPAHTTSALSCSLRW